MSVPVSPDLTVMPAGSRDPVHPAITEALISDLVEQFYAKVQKDPMIVSRTTGPPIFSAWRAAGRQCC